MGTLAEIIKQFETTMSSAAFAEAGEFEMARQFMLLGKNARKRVLLGTDAAEIDLKIIRYTLKLCQRVEAGLEIFHLVRKIKEPEKGRWRLKKSGPSALQAMLQKLGIVYQAVVAEESLDSELVKFVAQRRDILCVVLGGAGNADRRDSPAYKKLSAVFQRLHCPLVIYEDSI
jgi:hypothetical protein